MTESTTLAPALTLPALAPGIELLGEYKGSGYREAPQLIRRADGQVLQLSRLAYLVAAAANGSRDPDAIATVVSQQHSRPLGADGVAYLIENKLAPLGIISSRATATEAAAPRAKPLLSLMGRVTLLSPRAANVAGAALHRLFHVPVVAAVLVGLGALDYWLFFQHGLRDAVHQVITTPALLLGVVGLTLVSAVFHELGHAAGCRHGGARPGAIGFGLYLIWPSFFTDVTDAYRLDRRGRLRTDLGGIYFNAVFMLALAGAYALTGWEVLLLVVVISHAEVVEQLMPFVRFDGYFILSDLIGIPDLFARIGPILRSVRRSGRSDPRVRGLRRSARVLVTVWVACVVPLLLTNIGYLLLHLPLIEQTLLGSAAAAAQRAWGDLSGGRYLAAAAETLGCLLVALPSIGVLYLVLGMARRAVAAYVRRPRSWLPHHAVALVLLTAFLFGLGFLWGTEVPLPPPP